MVEAIRIAASLNVVLASSGSFAPMSMSLHHFLPNGNNQINVLLSIELGSLIDAERLSLLWEEA
jgi:hypothetical protein